MLRNLANKMVKEAKKSSQARKAKERLRNLARPKIHQKGKMLRNLADKWLKEAKKSSQAKRPKRLRNLARSKIYRVKKVKKSNQTKNCQCNKSSLEIQAKKSGKVHRKAYKFGEILQSTATTVAGRRNHSIA